MKPINLTKDDEAYRSFLKKVLKIKKKEDFLARGLTVQELETCIRHAYKSLTKQRLKGYNSYVQSQKAKIYEDMEKMKKLGEQTIKAPDNLEKNEQFNNFVDTIRKLIKTEQFESVIQKPALIAEKLYSKKKAKSRIAFVKKFLKNNYDEIKERSQAHEQESDDDISNNADRSVNSLAKVDQDKKMSDIENRFENMSTEDDDISDGKNNDSGIVTNQISNGDAEASLDNKESNGEDHQLSVTEQNRAGSSVSNVGSFASDNYNSISSSWLSAQVSSISTQTSDCDNDDLISALTNSKAKLSSSAKRRLSSDGNAYNGTSIAEALTANRQDRKRFRSASMPIISAFLSTPARADSSFNKENIVAVDDNVILPANIEDSCGGNGKRNIFSKRFFNTLTIMEFDNNSIKTTEDNPDHTENSNDLINVDEETTFEDNNIDFHGHFPSTDSVELHGVNGNSDDNDSISSPCSFKTALTTVDVLTVGDKTFYLSSRKESSSGDGDLNLELKNK